MCVTYEMENVFRNGWVDDALVNLSVEMQNFVKLNLWNEYVYEFVDLGCVSVLCVFR